MVSEQTTGGLVPGSVDSLEAVEEAQVRGGEEGRLREEEDVVEELGVEALHVCVRVCCCAGGASVIFWFDINGCVLREDGDED